MQTGIARMMGEVTRRYARGELLVSTGQHRDSQESDVRFSGALVDRLPVPSKALRNLAGLLFWSRRVATLARQYKPRFAWCDSIAESIRLRTNGRTKNVTGSSAWTGSTPRAKSAMW